MRTTPYQTVMFGNTGTIAFPLARVQIPLSWQVPPVPIPVPVAAVYAGAGRTGIRRPCTSVPVSR